MTKAWAFLGVLTVISFGGCKGGNEPFFNEHKWKILDEWDYYRLKASPRKVTEYEFGEKGDTSEKGKRNFYSIYELNAEGDLLSKKIYMSDKLSVVSETEYDSRGYQQKTWAISPGFKDTANSECRALGGGRYKSVSLGKNGVNACIYTFSDHGKDCKQEKFHDSAASGQPYEVYHSFYEGQRVVKREMSSSEGSLEQRFYYSAGDSPDSIESVQHFMVVQRELFVNNKMGDPILYWKIQGKDTLLRIAAEYEYDREGNWVWKRERMIEKNNLPSYLTRPAGGSVSVVEREFVY